MAHVTKFFPKLPIFINLRRMVSCPILRRSNPFLGPHTHLYPSKYLPKHVFSRFPPSKRRRGFLLPHIKVQVAKFPKTCQNAPCWRLTNVPERYANRVGLWPIWGHRGRTVCCACAVQKVGHSPPPVGSFLGVGLPQGTIAIVYLCSINPPPSCVYLPATPPPRAKPRALKTTQRSREAGKQLAATMKTLK